MRLVRRSAATTLAFCALALALALGAARRTAARLDGTYVRPGEDPAAVLDVASSGPFAPFRVAVTGPLRGDADALGRVLGRLRGEAPPVDLLVLLGDLTRDGGDDELRLLRATLASCSISSIALPGAGDLTPDRAERVQSWLGPRRFAFVRNEHRFIGLCGDAGTFLRDAGVSREPGLPLWWFGDGDELPAAAGTPWRHFASRELDRGGDARLEFEVVTVASDGTGSSQRLSVPRGPSLAGTLRRVEVVSLVPVAASDALFTAALAACALALGSAYLVWNGAGSAGGILPDERIAARPVP